MAGDLAGFFQPSKPQADGVIGAGNVPWAVELGEALKAVVRQDSAQAPRSQQVALGPSEVGHPCDRQVAGKYAGIPRTNHVFDPWPSWAGTGLHAHIERALKDGGDPRWLPETRVPVAEALSGTADLYDLLTHTVIDHKFLGSTTLDKVRRVGAGQTYRKQLLLYGRGYRRLGVPVRRVMLMCWPRTGSSLAGAYAYGIELDADTELETDLLLETVIPARKKYAADLISGKLSFHDIPAQPTNENCFFCPFWRPEEAQTASTCRGHVGNER